MGNLDGLQGSFRSEVLQTEIPEVAFMRRNSWPMFLAPAPLVGKERREEGLRDLGLCNSPAKIFIHL